jgi:Bacteriophage tail sheath protein
VSVTVSYPGVYIEELPSSSHSVTPAPTSVTVFAGFTNPFWSLPDGTAPPFGQAYPLLSFADYEAAFGGFFSSPHLPDYVGEAVFQFFENGGSTAYAVALKSDKYWDWSASPPTVTTKDVNPASVDFVDSGKGFTFTALQPVGVASQGTGLSVTVTIGNLTNTGGTADDTADITITYGSSVETYRRVPVSQLVSRITGTSRLVSVAAVGTPTAYTALAGSKPLAYAGGDEPAASSRAIDLALFADVFAANAPLDKVTVFNLLLLPGITDAAVLAEALAYAEHKRAFFIMDPPANAVADAAAVHLTGAPSGATPIADMLAADPPPLSENGALYFPYLRTTDPVTGAALLSPPSGYVAGVFAREDVNRGVWKSPAGLEATILGTTGVVPWGVMTDPQNGVLYSKPNFVNCIRSFPGVGTVVFGARTLVAANDAYEQWRYVAVRRMALFIEQSLYASLKWAIFEPNDTPLWNALTQQVQAFMLGLYRQGAFQGSTTDKAFRVQCDSSTTTQNDIDQGIVNIIVSFAPLKPAEFVVVKIAQLAGQSQT